MPTNESLCCSRRPPLSWACCEQEATGGRRRVGPGRVHLGLACRGRPRWRQRDAWPSCCACQRHLGQIRQRRGGPASRRVEMVRDEVTGLRTRSVRVHRILPPQNTGLHKTPSSPTSAPTSRFDKRSRAASTKSVNFAFPPTEWRHLRRHWSRRRHSPPRRHLQHGQPPDHDRHTLRQPTAIVPRAHNATQWHSTSTDLAFSRS